jgi:hypothetical protein
VKAAEKAFREVTLKNRKKHVEEIRFLLRLRESSENTWDYATVRRIDKIRKSVGL